MPLSVLDLSSPSAQLDRNLSISTARFVAAAHSTLQGDGVTEGGLHPNSMGLVFSMPSGGKTTVCEEAIRV